MTRAIQSAAKNSLNTTNKIGSGYQGQAQDLYSSLEPQLQAEATNPTGYNPSDKAAMETGGRQAVGGTTAAITGQADLGVARNRNSAGYNATLDSAARSGGQQNSQDELAIQAANADLKQKQQQTALSSLGQLYGTNVGAGESYYGMAPSELNAWSEGGRQGWLQNVDQTMSAIGDLGKGVGAAASGFSSAPSG